MSKENLCLKLKGKHTLTLIKWMIRRKLPQKVCGLSKEKHNDIAIMTVQYGCCGRVYLLVKASDDINLQSRRGALYLNKESY